MRDQLRGLYTTSMPPRSACRGGGMDLAGSELDPTLPPRRLRVPRLLWPRALCSPVLGPSLALPLHRAPPARCPDVSALCSSAGERGSLRLRAVRPATWCGKKTSVRYAAPLTPAGPSIDWVPGAYPWKSAGRGGQLVASLILGRGRSSPVLSLFRQIDRSAHTHLYSADNRPQRGE